MGMSFTIGNDRKLIILDPVLERLLAHRQIKKRQREAGGFLIGRHLLENDHLVVDQITEPTWWDNRLRRFFFRSNRHNQLAYKAWHNSNKTQTLLGLWHTHPEFVPNPSGEDFNDWRKTLLHEEYFGDFLVFMIIGIQKIRLWRGDRRAQFLELVEISNTAGGL